MKDFSIRGSKGSAAEKYALDNGFKFIDRNAYTPLGSITLDEKVFKKTSVCL